MVGMFVARHGGREYWYIAMEACSTSLWKYLGVACPKERDKLLLPCMPQHYLLGIAKGAMHIHRLGIFHGDLSLANVLLTWDHTVRLCDYGTAHAQDYISPDKLCVTYIRPPESVAGSQNKGTPVDAWAVGIIALALFTRRIPTLPPTASRGNDADDRTFAFLAAASLLEPITEETWPGHAVLPKWHTLNVPYRAVSPKGTLSDYMAGLPKLLPIGAWAAPKELVQSLLRWDPAARASMGAFEEYLREHFEFPRKVTGERSQKHGRHPDAASDAERDEQLTQKKPRAASPARQIERASSTASIEEKLPRAAAAARKLERASSAACAEGALGCQPEHNTCICSGNCGREPCTMNMNRRRGDKKNTICDRVPAEGVKRCEG